MHGTSSIICSRNPQSPFPVSAQIFDISKSREMCDLPRESRDRSRSPHREPPRITGLDAADDAGAMWDALRRISAVEASVEKGELRSQACMSCDRWAPPPATRPLRLKHRGRLGQGAAVPHGRARQAWRLERGRGAILGKAGHQEFSCGAWCHCSDLLSPRAKYVP